MDDSRLLRQIADRTGVIDTVLRAARAMDVQDCPALRACLAATLDVASAGCSKRSRCEAAPEGSRRSVLRMGEPQPKAR